MFYNDYFVDCKLAHLVPWEDADRIFMKILKNYDSLKNSNKSLQEKILETKFKIKEDLNKFIDLILLNFGNS